MNDVDKKTAIESLYCQVMDGTVQPGAGQSSYHDVYKAYHDEVVAFAKRENPAEDEKEAFYDKFLYKKNGTSILGSATSGRKEKPATEVVARIFKPLLGIAEATDANTPNDEEIERQIENMRAAFYKAVGANLSTVFDNVAKSGMRF